MKSPIIATAKPVGEINHQVRMRKQKEGIQQLQLKLGHSGNKHEKTKCCMGRTLEVWIDSLLVENTRCYGC